jgi:hypothetical protein
MRNHQYLCYTNLLLIISLIYFIYCKNNSILEYILASFLIVTIVCSQLFWNNPIRYSNIHKIDAIIAKIVIISFIVYTLIYKFKLSYLFILIALFTSFYFSNKYSSQEWCSNKHIFCHGLLHIFCFIASLYAFFP